MSPDYNQTKQHLSLLDKSANEFTFQTFDDNSDRRLQSLVQLFSGSLEICWPRLAQLNEQGAGIFVTVNETDGRGRKHENIIRIRSLWVDDDGDGRKPELSNFSVETSPEKYHHYVLVKDLRSDEFEAYQQHMVDVYKSDPKAKDRARVLRLAGFFHQKISAEKRMNGNRHMVRITDVDRLVAHTKDQLGFLVKPFSRQSIPVPIVVPVAVPAPVPMPMPMPVAVPPPVPMPLAVPAPVAAPKPLPTTQQLMHLADALSTLDLSDRNLWISTGSALKSIGEPGFTIWHKRSSECGEYNGEQDCRRTWGTLASDRTGYEAIFSKAQKRGWVNPNSKLTMAQKVFTNPPQRDAPDKMYIHVNRRSLDERVNQAVVSLSNMQPPTIYQRGSELISVENTGLNNTKLGQGGAVVRRLNVPGLRVKLSEAANWIKGDGYGSANPCDKTAAGLLESPSRWQGIPVLDGISKAPILKANGQLITRCGYEPESRLYLCSSIPDFNVPIAPTREDASLAAEHLLEAFSEFPFASPDLDRSVLLAYMLTLTLRHEFPTAPLFGIDASTAGSGKDLLANSSNIIALGTKPSVMTSVKGSGAEEETRKRITAVLSQGESSVVLDNWNTPVEGESLNVVLTSEYWSDRILGKSESVKLPSRVTWAVTGNNLQIKGDMTRRALILRLDPEMENPEQRNFTIPDLNKHLMSKRGEYLSDLFTIIKAHKIAAYPQMDSSTLGSFEEWHRRVASCLVWIGYSNPVNSQERLRNSDPEKEKYESILTLLNRVYKNAAFRVSDLTKPEAIFSSELSELKILLLEVAPSGGSDVNPVSLGRWFARHVDRIAAGLVLRKVMRVGKSNASSSYFVEAAPTQPSSAKGL